MSCVVIIDDSVVVRKIVETSMSRAGVHCLSFRNGYEALRAFQTQLGQPPDLIFLDINLPLIDGFDLLRLLRSHPDFDRVVIVMLSSRDSVLDRVKCRLAGARAYLVKPFRTQDLLAMLAQYLPAFSAGATSQATPPYPEGHNSGEHTPCRLDQKISAPGGRPGETQESRSLFEKRHRM